MGWLSCPAIGKDRLGVLTIPCGGNSRRRDGPRQNDPHGQQINLANLPGASYSTVIAGH